ncbi:WbqC family protein [Arthrobacter sp.]|uniref:WbqC family protein n=1 Tax=Arthrobacter sp. TaxID=1667 RepID=UPI0026DFD7B8|nr:WbqC family protein [Arthrobacter sp.]MDO5752142.1 WbqC family protein [Arthrobacter sp.]
MVTVSIHQPNFMPWLKLMAKTLDSDVFVAYDSVQFTRKEFHARQLFRTSGGEPRWLTVPVVSTGARQMLNTVRVVMDTGWREEHLDFLTRNYSKAAHFEEVFTLIQGVYERQHELLVDHNLDLIEQFCRYLGSEVKIMRATSIPHAGTREERLLDLVLGAGGDSHLTSTMATHVIDWSGFDHAGIPIRVQEFEHPVYQQGTLPFLPNLATADMLFHTGTDAAEILAAGSAEHQKAASSPV